MFGLLHQLRSGHATWHVMVIVLLVFVATPLLRHALYKRGRGGSIYQPPRKPEWTAGQVGQARRLLKEKERERQAEARARKP